MSAIVPVETARHLSEFVELPYRLYAGHPHWVPPLRRDERRRFSRQHNAFLQHADMRLWLLRDRGRITGRIAAIDDRRHNEHHDERVTWFGFFEAEDAAAAQALLGIVEQHAHSRGSTAVRGPANPSLNESAGLLIDAFDADPCILMPYNPPDYPGFIEQSGYAKKKDLLAWSLDLTVPLGERITMAAARARRRHRITVRTVELSHFERDLAVVLEIYRAAWSDNWGFVPPTEAEVRQLAADLRPILDPHLILVAEQAGRPVGCAVAIPDANQLLKRLNGHLLPFGVFHFLRRRSIITAARALLLGVAREFRRTGVYPLLVEELHRRGVARGYTRGELSWTLEDNNAVNAGIEAAGGVRHKTYRLYEKPVA
jgi:hypothetical protein